MMKKLLVLLLVFGITSIANAALIDVVIVSWGPGPDSGTTPINPTDHITLNPSEWIDVDLVFTPDGSEHLSQASLELTLVGNASMYLDDLTFPPGAWDTPPFSPGITEVVPGKQYIIQYGEGMAGAGTVDIIIDHILIHCDGEPDEVILSITADVLLGGIGSMTSDYKMIGMGLEFGPGITITQIPEPMTIALLGLGGLFLLRRRK
jgi:hypothetical protein